MAAIWQERKHPESGGPIMATTRAMAEEAISGMREWAIEDAEDAESGMWLVRVSPRVARRLAAGREYSTINRANGWRIAIDLP